MNSQPAPWQPATVAVAAWRDEARQLWIGRACGTLSVNICPLYCSNIDWNDGVPTNEKQQGKSNITCYRRFTSQRDTSTGQAVYGVLCQPAAVCLYDIHSQHLYRVIMYFKE